VKDDDYHEVDGATDLLVLPLLPLYTVPEEKQKNVHLISRSSQCFHVGRN
jgi:hypothetical protein